MKNNNNLKNHLDFFESMITINIELEYIINKEVAKFNLNKGDVFLLQRIDINKGVHQYFLIKNYNLDKKSTRNRVNKMHDMDLIQIKIEKRKKLIFLTEKGKNIVAQLLQIRGSFFDEAVKDVGIDDPEEFLENIKKLKNWLKNKSQRTLGLSDYSKDNLL